MATTQAPAKQPRSPRPVDLRPGLPPSQGGGDREHQKTNGCHELRAHDGQDRHHRAGGDRDRVKHGGGQQGAGDRPLGGARRHRLSRLGGDPPPATAQGQRRADSG